MKFHQKPWLFVKMSWNFSKSNNYLKKFRENLSKITLKWASWASLLPLLVQDVFHSAWPKVFTHGFWFSVHMKVKKPVTCNMSFRPSYDLKIIHGSKLLAVMGEIKLMSPVALTISLLPIKTEFIHIGSWMI